MNDTIKIKIENLFFAYKKDQWLFQDIATQFTENSITSIIGPSGIGKTSFLMILNRLWEGNPQAQMKGKVQIKFNNEFLNIYDKSFSLSYLRRLVGMVFQTPTPLPMSIYKNVVFPLKLAGCADKALIQHKAEQVLKKTFLWEEVKDRLSENALSLSGGQQQRLCIARALISEPQILLFDEPTSFLDVRASSAIEELLLNLKQHCTLIVVSHYLNQVKRIADKIIELSENHFYNC